MSGVVKKKQFKITETGVKIPSITGLVTNTALNTKGTYTENKLPELTYLTTSYSEQKSYRD